MAEDVTLRVLLTGEDRSASRALRGAGEAAEKAAKKTSLAGQAMKGILAAGVVDRAAGAILEFGKDSVSAFAELQDVTAAAGVTFGDSMDKIEQKANGAAVALGISKQQYIDGALTMGTFGKSAGLTGDSLANFSNELVQTAGDMASFRGTTPEEAILAVGAALRGETEPIRKYGVMLDDATLRQQAMSMGLIKSTKESLTPANKVLAAQALILAKTADAHGDFARTADSTANVQKRLDAQTKDFSATLGSQLAPVVTEVQEGLSNLMGTAGDTNSALAPLTDTALAVTTAFNDVTKAMNGGTEAGKLLKPVWDQLNIITGVKPLQDLANAYVGWSGSANGATTAAQGNAGATRDSTAATTTNTSATNTNSGALQTNAEKLDKVYNGRLKLRGDKRSLEAAIDGATESLKKNGKTLDESTPKGRANAQALDDIASAGLAVGGNMNKSRTAFIKAATSMGMSADEAKNLATKLGLIKSKKVKVDVNVAWHGDLNKTFKIGQKGSARVGFRKGGRPRVGEIAQFHKDEFWVPDTAGTVISQQRSRSMMGAGPGSLGSAGMAGGGNTYNSFTFNGVLTEAEAGRVYESSLNKLSRTRGRGGFGV